MYVKDKLVITRYFMQYKQYFPFSHILLLFRLKAREVSRQNMRDFENIRHIILVTLPILYLSISFSTPI